MTTASFRSRENGGISKLIEAVLPIRMLMSGLKYLVGICQTDG